MRYEPAISRESVVHAHMKQCPEIQYLSSLLAIGLDKFNCREINIHVFDSSTTIIASSDNSWELLIKEALYIKQVKPFEQWI